MEIKVAFKNNKTIAQILRSRTSNNTPIYNKCGVYKLTCKYVNTSIWDKPVEI
jgi:hypothetical protein